MTQNTLVPPVALPALTDERAAFDKAMFARQRPGLPYLTLDERKAAWWGWNTRAILAASAAPAPEPQWGPILDALDGFPNDCRDDDFKHLERLIRAEHERTLDRIDAARNAGVSAMSWPNWTQRTAVTDNERIARKAIEIAEELRRDLPPNTDFGDGWQQRYLDRQNERFEKALEMARQEATAGVSAPEQMQPEKPSEGQDHE